MPLFTVRVSNAQMNKGQAHRPTQRHMQTVMQIEEQAEGQENRTLGGQKKRRKSSVRTEKGG